jgi:XTP/dITP diphosphohydrolase
MMDLLIATQNQGKLREYRRILADSGLNIVGLDDVGLGDLDVEETGATFAENAILKAKTYAEASGKLVLADDSGLVVDALNGEPGVYSARYGGSGLDDAGRRKHLLENMRDIAKSERSARFKCVIAIVEPKSEKPYTAEGACEGQILLEERDTGKGFGYDALFLPDGFTKSFAELDSDEKNRISHRGNAAKKLPEILARLK